MLSGRRGNLNLKLSQRGEFKRGEDIIFFMGSQRGAEPLLRTLFPSPLMGEG